MMKYICIGLGFLCLFNIAAHAGTVTNQVSGHKEEIGLGLGALLGGLIAGPPGAIVGAAGGAWLGDKESREDSHIAGLEERLLLKNTELAYLQGEFSDLESRHNRELHKVKLDNRISALEELSRGISLTIYFRTNQTNINPDIIPRIKRLARYLQDFPEIQIHLEGHADRRGPYARNKVLSQHRAQSVVSELIRAGLKENRIHVHAHGESQAAATDGDLEGYIFDRRVNIHLSIDTEA